MEFLNNFLAGLAILVLGSWLLPKYLKWLKRPRLVFLLEDLPKNEFKMTRAEDKNWEGVLKLLIKNDSPSSFRDVYYNLFVPAELSPKIGNEQKGSTINIKLEDRYYRIFGLLEGPIYPKTHFLFPYEISIKTGKSGDKNIYYYFSTDLGVSPTKAKVVKKEIKKEDIDKALSQFNKIIIKIPQGD